MPTPNQSTSLDPEIRRIVDNARNIWARKLTDYSRNNPLLFYRDLKTSTLDLTARMDVVNRLLRGEKLTIESLTTKNRFPNISAAAEHPQTETQVRHKIQTTLVSIHRKTLSIREEKGIETLNLAIGIAQWPASDNGRPYNAPILLMPSRIDIPRRNPKNIQLAISGEPRLNPILTYIFQKDYDISLATDEILSQYTNETEPGQWNINTDSIFNHIISVAKTIHEFQITPRVILANFRFAKMAMVEDLNKNGNAIASSPIVAAIAGHSESRQKLAQTTTDLNPEQLDDLPASNDHLVLDADSTQHRAIVLAGKQQNGVIQGPPGTGKSQTIANLIAQSVAEGRRILFVAEKRAALDAVIKRLQHPNVNLGHLILDLHGVSISKKEVMTHLGHTLQQIKQAQPADNIETVHLEFEKRRKNLNQHAKRINTPRQPTGLSVHQMIGQLLLLPTEAKSSIRLRGDALTTITSEYASEIKEAIQESSAYPTLFLGTDASPWNNARITTGNEILPSIDLAQKTFTLWQPFHRLLEETMQKLGTRLPQNLDETATLLAVLRDISRIHEQYKPEIFSQNLDELARTLQPATQNIFTRSWTFISNKKYRDAQKHLVKLRKTPASPAILQKEVIEAENILRQWHQWTTPSSIPRSLNNHAQLTNAFTELNNAIKNLDLILAGSPLSTSRLAKINSLLQSLNNDPQTPYRLPNIYKNRSFLQQARLSSFLEDLHAHSVPRDHWINRFNYIWFSSTLDHVRANDPDINAFNGHTHQQLINDFIQLDRQRIRLAASHVRKLHATRAITAMNQHPDQGSLIRNETSKKSRHLSIKQLLTRAPDVLMQIAPCWVASPLSVSELLDGSKQSFDIVIFDEASQIFPEEAIPALYRAKQVVVAGDQHQLPPTNFFDADTDEEDDAVVDQNNNADNTSSTAIAATSGHESLLDTLNFLPNWLLEWHYRSEDERLITFSNTHIYEGRLVTFPNARSHDAIRHILVPHDPSLGSQEESASPEVKEVVKQVLLHAKNRPQESLGVIAMGIKHANRIQSELDRTIENRPELSDFFSSEREERFFVKNLETVQGDERDSIILSFGYSKSANGDLPHHFGPLTQDVGYRRLNVAVTRSKRRMCVISSFSHQDIDLNRSKSRGVQLLKAYLEYAATQGERLPDQEQAGIIPLNPFETDVRDALESRGIKTRSQFGASRYRIDLVAMHPQKPGQPILAIECDGASYHSSPTARDRDRLRQSHLQKLGWRFHRIWSTDWFHNREQEINRAVVAYEDAVKITDSPDTKSQDTIHTPSTQPPPPPNTKQRGPRPYIPQHSNIKDYYEWNLRQLVQWIESDGLNRTHEELLNAVFDELPFQRLGPRIRKYLQKIIQNLYPNQKL